MTLNEIKKYVRQLELAGQFSDYLKFNMMKEIKKKYDIQKTFFSSQESNALAGELEELRQLNPRLIPDDLPKVRATWNQLMTYLNDKTNSGKTLHSIIRNKIEKKILDNYPFIRYQTHHSMGIAMHRLNIFANKASYSLISRSEAKRIVEEEAIPLKILLMGIESLQFIILLPHLLTRGVIHAITRDPLSIDQQKAFFEKLELISDAHDKRTIIYAISKMCRKNESDSKSTFISESSKDLYYYLKDVNHQTRSRDILIMWNSIVQYIKKEMVIV